MTNKISYPTIIATGSYLPENIITNHDLVKNIDTSDEWIQSRTGIAQRHIAANDEYTSHLATKAAQAALTQAKLDANKVDMIIVATTTPDQTFPSVATKVQAALGAAQAASFDIQAVCSGFVYALSIANSFIRTGQANTILVIGAEKMSSILDWNDRRTCVLFGDGAGAVLLAGQKDPNRGILSTHLFSDGSFQHILKTDGGTSSSGNAGFVQMDGQEVFKHAIGKMSEAIHIALKANDLQLSDIQWLVPHQANSRIMEMLSKKLNITSDHVISYIAQHANTSAASIPLALDHAARQNLFHPGDLIALTAIGGGLTWGSCLLRW